MADEQLVAKRKGWLERRRAREEEKTAREYGSSRWRALRASSARSSVGVEIDVMSKREAKRVAYSRRLFRARRGHGRQRDVARGYRG